MSELSWSNTDNQFANLTADAEGSDLIVRYNDLTTFLNGNNLDATSNLNASAVFPWTNRHTWIVSDAANNNRSLTVSAIMAITKYGDYITSSAAQVNAALVYRSLTNASSTIPVVHYVNAGTGDTVKSVNSNTGANFLAETTSTGKAYKAKVRSLEDLHAPLMSKVLTTATTVSNSDTETEVEDLTIIVPADFLKVGTTIKGTIYGLMDTPAAATSDISITLKYGTVTLLTTGVITPTASLVDSSIKIDFILTVLSIGVTGTIESQGMTAWNSNTAPANRSLGVAGTGATNGSPITINTTTETDLKLLLTWATAVADCNIEIRSGIMEIKSC